VLAAAVAGEYGVLIEKVAPYLNARLTAEES